VNDLAQLITAIAAVIASVAIPVVIERRSRRHARVEYMKSIHDMWMHFDAVALSDHRLLELADEFNDPDTSHATIDERRKKWLAYMVINIHFARFVAAEQDLSVDPFPEAMGGLCESLRRLVRDPVAYAITQNAYQGRFKALCEELRAKHESAKPTQRLATATRRGRRKRRLN
jgi:hypothetical protein